MSSNVVILSIVVPVCCITIGLIIFRLRLQRFIQYLFKQKTKRLPLKQYSNGLASTLRGNLVRTYNKPINEDFDIILEQELGKGGVGVVVVCEKKDTKELYAVKIVDKFSTEIARLDRELVLLKDVDHTNIVRLFRVYDVPSHIYFVMELCSGDHLGNLLARQQKKFLDEEWTKRLFRQLVSAVAHIHSRGIAHRDIKLQNILLDHANDKTSQVKLIDFGYGARFVNSLPMKTKCGTPYTTAPEVFRERYDERCDVWSLGVVLYIMLCGRRPFESLDIAGHLADAGRMTMITSILAGRYHMNHPAFASVSNLAKTFITELLHPNFEERMTSKQALDHIWVQGKQQTYHEAQLVKLSGMNHSARAIDNMKLVAWNSARQIGNVALVFGLQPKVVADLRALFQSFDTDNSGALSRDEYIKAMAIFAPDLSREDVERLFTILDIDNDGGISYTEFLSATLDPRQIDINGLNEAFRLMDADGNGFIEVDEIRRMLSIEKSHKNTKQIESSLDMSSSYYDDFSDEEEGDNRTNKMIESRVQEMMDLYDVNHDGKISYDEFIWALTGASTIFGDIPATKTATSTYTLQKVMSPGDSSMSTLDAAISTTDVGDASTKMMRSTSIRYIQRTISNLDQSQLMRDKFDSPRESNFNDVKIDSTCKSAIIMPTVTQELLGRPSMMKKQSSVRKNRVEPHVINKTEIDSSSTSGVNFDKMERLREEKDFDANDTTYIKPITDKDTVAIDINAMIRANSGTRSPETHIPEDKQETFNNPAKRVLLSSFRNLNSFKGAITGIVGVNLGQYSNINGSNSISGGVEFDSQSSITSYSDLSRVKSFRWKKDNSFREVTPGSYSMANTLDNSTLG